MKRLLFAFLPLIAAGCAARTPCPSVDPHRLAEAVARELLARAGAANEGGSVDETIGDDAADEPATRMRVPIAGRPALGGPAALVTIVVFSDFQCPFCARVQPTLAELFRRYPGQVRLVFRNAPLPFHDRARPAAEAAMEAYAQRGDDGFWSMHDLLFQNQSQLAREDLERYAGRIGLDLGAFRRALDAETHEEGIEADLELAQRVGANGTPNFFVNGMQLVGAQPLDAFVAAVDRELATARALVAGGVPAEGVYDALMADAATSAPEEPEEPEDAAPAPLPGRPDPQATYSIELSGHEPQLGRDDALVTIVEWSDFQCPFCARVAPTLAALREQYGDDLRIVWMNNPLAFHQNAMPAALAAAEAYAQGGDRKFWAMHDLLFEHQTELTRENLEAYATQLHLNLVRFRRALDGRTHAAAIEAQQALGHRFGADGTPAFYVNGRYLAGAQPIERFRALVDAELAEARALVASGVRRRDVYARTIADGLAEVDRSDAGDEGDDPDRVVTMPLPAHPIFVGPEAAPITLQVFSDFQCPFCQRIEPTLAALRERYGDRLRIVWRDYPLPFHPNAMQAAEAAREVNAQLGAAGFFRYHDVLFENQTSLDRESLERFAESLPGIDMAAFRRALETHKHRRAVQADMDAVAAAGIDAFGTPTTFIEGHMVSGAQPIETFVDVIDALLRSRGLRVPEAAR